VEEKERSETELASFPLTRMPVYAFGSNEHHQVDQRAPLHLTTPYRSDDSSKILAASWSQAVICELFAPSEHHLETEGTLSHSRCERSTSNPGSPSRTFVFSTFVGKDLARSRRFCSCSPQRRIDPKTVSRSEKWYEVLLGFDEQPRRSNSRARFVSFSSTQTPASVCHS